MIISGPNRGLKIGRFWGFSTTTRKFRTKKFSKLLFLDQFFTLFRMVKKFFGSDEKKFLVTSTEIFEKSKNFPGVGRFQDRSRKMRHAPNSNSGNSQPDPTYPAKDMMFFLISQCRFSDLPKSTAVFILSKTMKNINFSKSIFFSSLSAGYQICDVVWAMNDFCSQNL